MKILFVSSGNRNYKISPLVKSQGKSLISNGISVDFFTIVGSYFKNLFKLRQQIITNNYDIIHAHYSYSALISLLTFTNVPIVVSYMGSDLQAELEKGFLNIFKYFLNKFIFKLTELFVTKIIVKSVGLYDLISFKKKAKIIPNGVDFNKYKPVKKSLARKKLGINKNFSYILFLANKKNKNKNFKLLEDSLKILNDNKIKLLDYEYPLDPHLVPNYINSSNLLVLTSFYEGSPNIIKEAMACCVPIVSVYTGDVKNIISNTDGCYLSKYDPIDFANNINKALNFKGRTNGRKQIRELEINKIAHKIIDLYKEIII